MSVKNLNPSSRIRPKLGLWLNRALLTPSSHDGKIKAACLDLPKKTFPLSPPHLPHPWGAGKQQISECRVSEGRNAFVTNSRLACSCGEPLLSLLSSGPAWRSGHLPGSHTPLSISPQACAGGTSVTLTHPGAPAALPSWRGSRPPGCDTGAAGRGYKPGKLGFGGSAWAAQNPW